MFTLNVLGNFIPKELKQFSLSAIEVGGKYGEDWFQFRQILLCWVQIADNTGKVFRNAVMFKVVTLVTSYKVIHSAG